MVRRGERQRVGSNLDIGLIPSSGSPTPATLPEPKVGPVRSGRLIYADIAAFFPDSCLIYAFASPEVLSQLPQCAFVTHDVQGGGYLLDIEEMKQLARDSRKPNVKIDYASNAFRASRLRAARLPHCWRCSSRG